MKKSTRKKKAAPVTATATTSEPALEVAPAAAAPDPVKVWQNPIVLERQEVPAEELRAGDVIDVFGYVTTVTAIKPYANPGYPEFFATVDTDPGIGFTLARDSRITRCTVKEREEE